MGEEVWWWWEVCGGNGGVVFYLTLENSKTSLVAILAGRESETSTPSLTRYLAEMRTRGPANDLAHVQLVRISHAIGNRPSDAHRHGYDPQHVQTIGDGGLGLDLIEQS